MPAALEIRALTRRLRAGVPGCAASVLVLSDVWLGVAQGERVAVCARSALDATTLLLCAALLLRPDRGTVRVGDGGAAYVPPAPPPLGGLTVAELLEWQRRSLLAGRAAAARPPRLPLDALRAAGCEELATVRARLLSPPSARRVAVARALVGRPALLAVDAPPIQSADAWREMERCLACAAREGAAVLFAAPAGVRLAADVRLFSLRGAAETRTRVPIPRRGGGRAGGAPVAGTRAVAEPAPPAE